MKKISDINYHTIHAASNGSIQWSSPGILSYESGRKETYNFISKTPNSLAETLCSTSWVIIKYYKYETGFTILARIRRFAALPGERYSEETCSKMKS